jgi:cysteine-rich repeat protein
MGRRQSRSARSRGGIHARRFAVPVFVFALAIAAAGSLWVSAPSVSGQAPAQCADGIDNDGDGQVDALATGGNPTATLIIGAGNPFAIRAIVNTGGYGIPDNGAIHRDAATVNKACQIQGYTAASGSDCTAPPYDNRCGWRSFGDNLMFAWNGTSFYSIRDNVWTSTITCIGIPAACGDGKDNDGDGKIDTADTGCANASDASEVLHDTGCMNAADPFEGVRQCSDGLDNDGDGKADAAGGDPGCTDGNDDSETDPLPPDPPPANCPIDFSSCGINAAGGAADQCGKEGKIVEWFAGSTCKIPAGGEGQCYRCVTSTASCPENFSCGTANGPAAAHCPEGKKLEWGTEGVKCALGGEEGTPASGRCFTCVDDPDAGGDDEDPPDDPPPMCPVGCVVDADCGGETQCEGGVGDPSTPLCWKNADGMCVKKCKIPRCVDKKCTLAPPAEGTPGYPYVQCAGMTDCPAARCGDGVIQAGEEAQDPGAPAGTGGATCNVTGTSCAQIPDARACSKGSCVDVNGRKIQGTSCTCPSAVSDTVSNPSIVASVVNGSSLLATSIINSCAACTQDFIEANCGAGDACFAWIGANNTYRRCAPATCEGREDACGMVDGAHEWKMCGSAVPPDEPDVPGAPVGEPTPADGEECDDGNNAANDGCSPSCKKEMCGDGAVQAKGADGLPNTADDELCDDGNRVPGDGCSNTCKIETCGNGTYDYGEECDNGAKNSDTAPGACRKDCKLAKCNDGVIDVWPQDFGLDEQCDCGPDYADFDWAEANKPGSTLKPYCETVVDGKPALCHVGNCQAFYCGDGFAFNAGLDNESGTADDEMCDAGPFNSDGLPEGAECANAAQCGGFPCVEGKCEEKSCFNDDSCDDGLSCIKGMCRPGGCNADADCKAGQKCDLTTGNCSSCTVDTDCASGYCHPNGNCAAMDMCKDGACDPEGYGCRMDCKMARCGDGIVDTQAGETCDEGAAMFKCNGYPQTSCDCGVPSWGSHTRPGGEPYNATCCPTGQYCVVSQTASCPSNCGVSDGIDGGGGQCGNHKLDANEECDTSVDGWQGQFSDWADAQVDYAYRPNRDGTQTAFVSDDGKWSTMPATIEEKYTTIDHSPSASSPDGAYIKTAGAGTAKTYFHLWDIPLTSNTYFSSVRIQVSVDFTGKGTGWKFIELPFGLSGGASSLSAVDMNAAVLEIVADETAHTLTFRLYHSTTGTPLTAPLVLASPLPPVGKSPIAIDAVQVAAFGTSLDESYSCNDCALIRCGNRIEDPGETCDDGNAAGGDGCSDRCELEICALPE